jgi:myo-inositol catabolism protein IolC
MFIIWTLARPLELPWLSNPLKMSQFIAQSINAVLSAWMLTD